MIELPWHVDLPPVRRWLKEMVAAGKEDEAKERIQIWENMVAENGVVIAEKSGKVGKIQLTYPKKGNAFIPPMYRLFTKAIKTLAEDDDIWVIIITGSGKNFSTGGYVGSDSFYAGLDAGQHASAAEPMRRTYVEMFQPMQKTLYEVEKPTIAMLNGPVLAEAVDLALAADIRTGHSGSDMWFSFGYSGNTAYTGSAWLLPRMVGISKAMELLLTAARITGQEAHDLGLINFFASSERLEDETMALANRITNLPPITLRLIKKQVHRNLELSSFVSALDVNSMIEPIVQFTQDHMDAENAVIEKRKPIVRGF
jgi:enoyl-CoA hydratase/carnithine racemase